MVPYFLEFFPWVLLISEWANIPVYLIFFIFIAGLHKFDQCMPTCGIQHSDHQLKLQYQMRAILILHQLSYIRTCYTILCCVYVYMYISTYPDDVFLLALDLCWQLNSSTPVCSIGIGNYNLCNISTYI